MSTGGKTNQPSPADRARAMRLFLHRKLDQLYERLTHPRFTGSITIELSGKDGRPGEPRTKIETYGVTEE